MLELLQCERYEVPFLWAYRRDYFAQHIPSREVRTDERRDVPVSLFVLGLGIFLGLGVVKARRLVVVMSRASKPPNPQPPPRTNKHTTGQCLWRIQRLDEKWEELHRRKAVVLQRMERFAAGHYGYQSTCLPLVCVCVWCR